MTIVEDMPAHDPLLPLLKLGAVSQHAQQATGAIAAAHRRPAALRKADVLVAESVLRGARLSTVLEGEPADVDKEPSGVFGQVIAVHGLLSPAQIQSSAATFRRSPANVLARMDVAAGGDGVARHPRRVHALVGVMSGDVALAPQVVHAEIAAHQLFGPRSSVIARAASRLAAVATGFDPRGLAVPEVHYHRHRRDYESVLAGWVNGGDSVRVALEFLLDAWVTGAREAEAIIAAA